ncbi:MAG TPA: LPS assembly protein LptD [Allosphingosinicella sp.]
MKKLHFICLTALPLLMGVAAPAAAQTEARPASQEAEGAAHAPTSDPLRAQSPATSPEKAPSSSNGPATVPAAAPAGAAEGDTREVAFASDRVEYDEKADLVTAVGDVRMNSEGNNLKADRVVWNRKTDEARAFGNVRVVTPEGHVLYGDDVVLTNAMKDAVANNLLLVLEDGGRLAAVKAVRKDGYTTLYRAAYTPCAVLKPSGCPKNPTWEVTAVKVLQDPVKHRIYYQGASLDILGHRIIPLPFLSHPDGAGHSSSGFLVPDFKYNSRNGLEIAVPYYLRIAPNRDLTVTPHVYTGVLPMLQANYREVDHLGAFQVGAWLTYGTPVPLIVTATTPPSSERVRFYLDANGKFQLDPYWSVTAALRYVTDRTFLARYDISRDVRLRSVINAERIDEDSYISIAGWVFQGLRITDTQGQQPIALPAIDARWRIPAPFVGGVVQLQANSLAITRTAGQDTQRAFASALWEHRSITGLGQELILTGFARGDVYHTDDAAATVTPIYRGTDGWHTRGIVAAAAEIRWPLVGEAFGGTQLLTPRVQLVATPPTKNLEIPNEDARSVDLEDSNLFALNRFPGYDRWEDSSRITYGLDYALDLPGIAVRTTIGQSYRLNSRTSILPQGTGLSDPLSDIVGRTTVKIGRVIDIVHRFRLDKDNLAIRRNEIDAVFGGSQTYATIGYLHLRRNIDQSIEDLRDREELRLSGRIKFLRYWSIFGSTTIDLTSKKEDPLSLSDGFQPVRHRLGIFYDDECIELGVTWRRDYDTSTTFKRGNTFLIRVALKNLGR